MSVWRSLGDSIVVDPNIFLHKLFLLHTIRTTFYLNSDSTGNQSYDNTNLEQPKYLCYWYFTESVIILKGRVGCRFTKGCLIVCVFRLVNVFTKWHV